MSIRCGRMGVRCVGLRSISQRRWVRVVMPPLRTSSLGAPVFAVIPNEYGALSECYAEGTLLPAGSNLNKHFTNFAMKVAGVEPQAKKKKFPFWVNA